MIQVGDGRCSLLILHCLDRPAPLLRSLRHSVYDDKQPPLAIIEAYVGTLPADVEELHEILYDVMILKERPEFDEQDEYAAADDEDEDVIRDAIKHFGPYE